MAFLEFFEEVFWRNSLLFVEAFLGIFMRTLLGAFMGEFLKGLYCGISGSLRGGISGGFNVVIVEAFLEIFMGSS